MTILDKYWCRSCSKWHALDRRGPHFSMPECGPMRPNEHNCTNDPTELARYQAAYDITLEDAAKERAEFSDRVNRRVRGA